MPVFLLQESVRFCHVILAAVPFFRDTEPAVITRCNPAHGGVRKAKVACILFTRISTTRETSVTFLPVNFY